MYFLKELVSKCREQYKNKLIAYFDFHGHSNKKNVFIYGPEYPIHSMNYFKTRFIPKILNKMTPMFRYHSCSFKINHGKRGTARAVFFREFKIEHSYTVEASFSGFKDSNGNYFNMDPDKYKEMGKKIACSIFEYINMVNPYESSKINDYKNSNYQKSWRKC